MNCLPPPSPATRLVLRADGGPAVGLGHVMRLLALADILGGQFAPIVFAVQAPADSLRELLAGAGLLVRELPEQPLATEAKWLLDELLQPDDILVLDGYGFDFEYQQAVRPALGRLVCLDDLHAFPFAADLVLNPAGGVAAAQYELRQPGARLLAGPKVAPLRRDFWPTIKLATSTIIQPQLDAADAPPNGANPDTVLLCLGGADPRRLTQRVATQLLALPAAAVWHLHVVVGSAYEGWASLRDWASGQPCLTLHRALPPAALATLMRECGAAVLSASTISYEYCAAGGGLLFTLRTADNQYDLDQFLRGAGLSLPYLSAANVLTSPEAPRIAAQLRAAQRQHFDGLMPARLRQAFAALQLPTPPFHLRPVTAADSELLLTWTNDPAVRQHSFNPAPVARPTHEAWLQARLADPQALLLLAGDAATRAAVGLIRFQVADQTATLSYQLAADWRGRGLAAPLLLAGTAAAAAYFAGLRQVRGHVQASNGASVRAFERAGFSRQAGVPDAPAGSLTFVWIV